MKKYLAVVGRSCSGKETIFKMAKEELAKTGKLLYIHHFSDPLNEILDILVLPKTRPNQQHLSTILRQSELKKSDGLSAGEEILGNVIYSRVLSDNADVPFLDGVRRPQDVTMLRALPQSHLIFISAPLEKRYEWLKARADRPGDANKTWEEFLSEQAAEAESKIDELRQFADFEIDNCGDLSFLKGQVTHILNCELKLV